MNRVCGFAWNGRRYSCLFLCLFLLWILLPVPAAASDPDTTEQIRTGWFEDSYNITGKDGERSGYGYEYQQSVASCTGWS